MQRSSREKESSAEEEAWSRALRSLRSRPSTPCSAHAIRHLQRMDDRAAEYARILAALLPTVDALAAGNPQRQLDLPLRLDLAPAALQCCMSLGAVGPEHVAVQSIERLCMDSLNMLRPLLAAEPSRYDFKGFFAPS